MTEQAPTELPSPQKLSKQLLGSAIALMLAGLVVALLAKVFVGVVIGLLGLVLGVGSQVTKKPPIN